MKGEQMKPLKIYTADELRLKDLRYKYEDIARYINNDDFKALDGSVVCFDICEFLQSVATCTFNDTSYVIYNGESYSSYLSHTFTFISNNDYTTITVFA